MRISSTTLLLSSVGVLSTTALAAPVRIVVVEKVSTDKLDDFFRSLRVGHAAAVAAGGGAMNGHGLDDAHPTDELHALPFPIDFGINPAPRPALNADGPVSNVAPDKEFDGIAPSFQSVHWTGGCRDASLMRVKFEKLEDRIRQWLGMTLVARSPLCNDVPTLWPRPTADMKKMVPPPGFVAPVHMPCHNAAATVSVASMSGLHNMSTRPPTRPAFWMMHRMRPKSFSGRIQRALNSLTPFESGVVAFVVGCGLGVLVRMIFVFIILGVRMWKCSQKRRDGQVRLGEQEGEDEDEKYGDEIVGVVLFDAGSIKAASVDNVSLYQEKV